MDYQAVEIELEGRVATVWMGRPERHNALDETLVVELDNAFQRLDEDDGVRVIVLGGRGKSFSAGADLNRIRNLDKYTQEENCRDSYALATMLQSVSRIRKPTIARIHGLALGGGVGLACACDIAVATTEAGFGMTEVKLGVVPATIGPYVVRAIGQRIAGRYFLTGERFDAGEALRIGMVHEVCRPDELDSRIHALASGLLAGGPNAQAATKVTLRSLAYRAIDDSVVAEMVQCVAAQLATAEAREGVRAFLEKRRPQWVEA